MINQAVCFKDYDKDNQENMIMGMINEKQTYREISNKTGVSIATISRINKRKTNTLKRRDTIKKCEIISLAEKGMKLKEIAEQTCYPENSIKSAFSRMSYSLRERNSREKEDILETLFGKESHYA